MMKNILVAIFIFTMMVGAIAADQEYQPLQKTHSKADILKLAQNYFGIFPYNEDELDKGELDTIVTDRVGTLFQMPFLNSSLINNALYSVDFHDIDIRINKGVVEEDYLHIKDFTVLVDPESGKLVQVVSTNEKDDSDFDIKPSSEKYTEFLTGSGMEILGLPDSPPELSFYEAILAARLCKPIYCKEITAFYVNLKFVNDSIEPVWYISCWWGKPIVGGTKYDHLSEHMTCNYSCIVDSAGNCRQIHTSPTRIEEMEVNKKGK